MIWRAILHVDMDAFYASVEQHDHPELRGRPVMVGGAGARGVVAAASYEARQYGVHSAMPAARARRLCPGGIFVPARFERYREVSRQVFAIFQEFSEQVEGLSLDEAYVDVSHVVAADHSDFTELGREIKRRIMRQTGLTASVGMAHNKLLAKIASDYDKPDGLVHIPRDEVRRFLDPLPVRRLWGVGPATATRLRQQGIYTVGQLRQTSPELLRGLFGSQADALLERAAGHDDRPVNAQRIRRSISQEITFARDCRQLEPLLEVLEEQAEELAQALVARELVARTITIKLRSRGFSTLTRSRSLDEYTDRAEQIHAVAAGLLRDWAGWRKQFAIRLVGVGVSGLASRASVEARAKDG